MNLSALAGNGIAVIRHACKNRVGRNNVRVDGIASLRGHVMPDLNLAGFMDLGIPAEQKVMMVANIAVIYRVSW